MAGTRDHLWIVVEQTRHAPYSPSGPVAVLRVDATTGHAETVLAGGSVDVTALAWPEGPPPVDADDYARFWQRRLGGLDAYWTDETGAVGPLSAGMSDPRVEIVGAWPETALHITFRWSQRPGLRLRRVVALYDERFFRMWTFYLAAAAVAFEHGAMNNFQVQYVRDRRALPLTRDYMQEAEQRYRHPAS